MSELNKLIELVEANRKLDPFYEGKESEELFSWLLDEIDEAKEEYAKNDYEELENEMGDVIWDVLLLLDKLQDEGKINKENVYKKIYKKISTRKSFLLEGRKVTKEEAMQIWNDAKRKEGYEESRLWSE